MSRSLSNFSGEDTSVSLVSLVSTNEFDSANITTLTASNLNISESITLDGDINASKMIVTTADLGDVSISQNIITLKIGSIFSTLRLIADTISLEGNLNITNTDILSFTNIQTKDLLITDPVTQIAKGNPDTNLDRGFNLNYNVAGDAKRAFMGISQEDKVFRLLEHSGYIDSDYPDIYYKSSDRSEITFGNLEIKKLFCTNFVPNQDDTNITIIADDITIGKDDGNVYFESHVVFKGEAEFLNPTVLNTQTVTTLDKNLTLFLDDAAKIESIIEDAINLGSYIITLEKDKSTLLVNDIIIIDSVIGTNNDKFNGLHTIITKPTDKTFTINLDTNIDVTSFTYDAAHVGKTTGESNLNDAGIIVYGYRNTNNGNIIVDKRIFYDHNNTQAVDSDWYINQNLKSSGSILLKSNKEIYNYRAGYGRMFVRDDGELYYENTKDESKTDNDSYFKITNNDDEQITSLNNWSLSGDKDTVYTYQQVGIGDSHTKDYQMKVDGKVWITGKLKLDGDFTANNVDAEGSLSVNGFKSTNLNTKTLTIEDRRLQIGYIDVTIISGSDRTDNMIHSRIDNKLTSGDIIYIQRSNIMYNNSGTLKFIDGFNKVIVVESTKIKLYNSVDDTSGIRSLTVKTFNQPRYTGIYNNNNCLINLSTIYSGTESVIVRILFVNNGTQFQYSLNGGYSYSSSQNLSTTDIALEKGIVIRFTKTSGFYDGEFYTFECVLPLPIDPDVEEESDEMYIGEYGKVLEKNEMSNSGFEIMMRDKEYNIINEKIIYMHNELNDKNSYFATTSSLQIDGTLKLNKINNYPDNTDGYGQIIHKDDDKLHFINDELIETVLDNEINININNTHWSTDINDESLYSYYKVGINITNPDKQLEVDGETRIRSNLYVDKSIYLGKTNNAKVVVDDDGNLYYYDTDGIKHELLNDMMDQHYNDLLVLTNWKLTNDEETIYSHQKVGINITNPDKQLEVDGETRIRSNLYVDKSIYLGKTNNAKVVVDDDGNLYYYDTDGIKHELLNDMMDQHYNDLLVLTNWKLTNDEETIYSHQKVGINITNPDKQLEVDGETRIRSNLYVDKSIYLGKTNNKKISVKDDNNLYFNDGSIDTSINSIPDNIIFNNISSWAITNDQNDIYTYNNVGIGIANPSTKLDIDGNARFRNIGSGISDGALHRTSDGTLTTSTSDRRLKKNIQVLSKGIETIEKLKPCSYEWKDCLNGVTKLGLIAQDVKEVIPEATFVNKSDGFMGIHDNHIMAVMIKAIQDQQKMIIKLEKDNLDKDNKINDIENKLNIIMNKLI